MSDKCWYLLQSKPRQEARAKLNLEQQGGACLHLHRSVEKIVSGSRKRIQESLFPGYLFLQLSSDDSLWSSVRSTCGVLRVVSFGEKPLPVADSIIWGLQRLTEQMSVEAQFKKGQKVTVTRGAFRGLQALFEEYDGEVRALLLLRLLQKQHLVKVPLDDLV
jgi:transcriptional antiterminator RfaH